MSLLKRMVQEFLKALAEEAEPIVSQRPVRCWDFRDKSLTLMPSEEGTVMYVQYHGAYGETPHVGDYVIFKATKPQGSRYRVTDVDWDHDVDWAWFAYLEFTPRTEEEVQRDERLL